MQSEQANLSTLNRTRHALFREHDQRRDLTTFIKCGQDLLYEGLGDMIICIMRWEKNLYQQIFSSICCHCGKAAATSARESLEKQLTSMEERDTKNPPKQSETEPASAAEPRHNEKNFYLKEAVHLSCGHTLDTKRPPENKLCCRSVPTATQTPQTSSTTYRRTMTDSTGRAERWERLLPADLDTILMPSS